ncbi:MAG: ribosome-associated translation inhibitor RaiA [Deltaproteobacteria bacterium]|nr:ribosome-associated translation inhibitor RaiA [Deltaproteobacteria bacterium]
MNVTVTFRHIQATEAIKTHVEDKLDHLKKYLIRPIEAHVILSVEKFRHKCEITLTARDFRAMALEVSEDLYASIDKAAHKLERQVRRHKEIVKEHKNHLSVHALAGQVEEEYKAVEENL